MAPRRMPSLVKWALCVLACLVFWVGLYVGGYAVLMQRDLPAVTEDGEFAYRSSFRFARCKVVNKGVTTAWPRVSPMNTVFEPIENWWRTTSGFIIAIPENAPFAKGQLDPRRIKKISVLLNPPEVWWAETYAHLEKCRRIEVAAGGAAEALCDALAGKHSVLDKDGSDMTVTGTVEAVIDDGGTVFLHFVVHENADVYVFHPESPSREPRANGHGQNTLLPWLKKHALQGEGSTPSN